MRENYVCHCTEVQKSSNFLPEIMALVSSANIMVSDKVFIVGGRSFMYIMKSKGPRIHPWGTPSVLRADAMRL
jgi:hypothetical protein